MNMEDTDLDPDKASSSSDALNTAVHLREMDYGSRITSAGREGGRKGRREGGRGGG